MITVWYIESVSMLWFFFDLCLHKIRESNTLNAGDKNFTDVNIGFLTVTLILMLRLEECVDLLPRYFSGKKRILF